VIFAGARDDKVICCCPRSQEGNDSAEKSDKSLQMSLKLSEPDSKLEFAVGKQNHFCDVWKGSKEKQNRRDITL